MSAPWAMLAAGAGATALLLSGPARPAGGALRSAGRGRDDAPERRAVRGLVLAGLAVLAAVAWWSREPPAWGAVPPTAPLAVLALVAAAAAGAVLVVRQRRRRAAGERADRVQECCELLAAELAAGLPVGNALARAAASEPLLRAAASAEDLGADVVAALRAAALVPGAAGLRRLAAAWEMSRRTGQRLGPAVGAAAATLRRDRATGRVVEAELASARATARLLAVLPVLALVLGGTGGRSWAFLLGTWPGLGCLVVGLALGVTGLAWIEHITDTARATR